MCYVQQTNSILRRMYLALTGFLFFECHYVFIVLFLCFFNGNATQLCAFCLTRMSFCFFVNGAEGAQSLSYDGHCFCIAHKRLKAPKVYFLSITRKLEANMPELQICGYFPLLFRHFVFTKNSFVFAKTKNLVFWFHQRIKKSLLPFQVIS